MKELSLASELQLRRLGSVGLLVRDTEVAVDAGLALCLFLNMPCAPLVGLLLGIHGLGVVAVAAFERVGFLHPLPDALREHVPVRLELLLRVDRADEMAPELEGRAELALDERDRLARHVAVGADGGAAGAVRG